MKKLLSFFVALICATQLFAYDAYIGRIYYNLDQSAKTAEVTNRTGASDAKSYLGVVVIPSTITYNSQTYSVTTIGTYAFSNCSGLTSVTIPSSVTTIGNNAFYYCSGLTSVTIPNSVTTIGNYAFYYCSGLTSVTIPNSVTTIGDYAFCHSGLTSVTIGNSVTTIGKQAFDDCLGLTTPIYNATIFVCMPQWYKGAYIIPNGIQQIAAYAFYRCNGLTSVTIPNSITTIGDHAFDECSSLTTPVYNANCFAYMPRSYTGAYTIPDGIQQIAGGAFYGCTGLTSVTIPNSVITIGNDAFEGCKKLTSVTIGNSVTTIGDRAFINCTGLTSITIGDSVTTIGYAAFINCSGLTSITIPNSVTTIEWNAFTNCNGLTKTNYTGTIADWCKIQFGDYWANPMCYSHNFYINDVEVKDLVIPNNVDTIGDYAFEYCYGLKTVTIPNSVTTIGRFAFEDCSGLTKTNYTGTIADWCKIKFGSYGANPMYYSHNFYINDVEVKDLVILEGVESVGDYAFYYCSGLTSVTIPNSVTTIGNYTFAWCSSLTSITIPNSVTTIGNSAFYGCSGLTSITCYATIPLTCGKDCFYNVSKSIPVYVPAHSVDAYKQADGWKEFTNIQANPNDFATVSCIATNGEQTGAGKYIKGDSCILTITPNYGYHFTQWSDGNTNNPRTFVVTQDSSFTTNCAKNTYSITIGVNDPARGTALGDTSVSYLDTIRISAMPNYGYHFARWNDGNTDNPRQVVATADTTYMAVFDANQYTISAVVNNGEVSGTGTYDYNTNVTLTAIANYGYQFTQWNDGDTDNPRSFVVTKDTTFIAQIDTIWSGKCGDNLYWQYNNDTLNIIGSGAMYDGQPWILFVDRITTISLPSELTTIGDSAFANIIQLNSITIPSNVTTIGANAFSGCRKLYDIYCLAIEPPVAQTSSFDNYNVYLHILCDNLRYYKVDAIFGLFKNIECISAEEKPITGDEVTVDPSADNVTITWPANDDAAEYKLVITKDGIVFCTLTFNAQGQLTGIAFAPNRAGSRMLDAAVMTANGWQFTVTGLDQASKYGYALDAFNASKQSIKHYEGEFATDGYTSLEWVTSDKIQGVNKMLYNGHLYILRDGNLYTATGARVK